MLIRFRVSNFLSFKDEVEFPINSRESTENNTRNHVISGGLGRNDVDLLRAGVIYEQSFWKIKFNKGSKFCKDTYHARS